MKTVKKLQSQSGFTLIELSIVLVIIGLIVGGVLVGQNLVKAAELRSTVTQIQQLNTSVNTFRGKYNGIPGDCNNCFSVFALGTADGNGNGQVEDAAVAAGGAAILKFDGEMAQFFAQLSSANMIEGTYTAASGTATLGTNFPASKHGRGGIIPYSGNGFNYYLLGAQSASSVTFATSGTSAGSNMMQYTITPEEAYQLDQKTDDGIPGTGVTRAVRYTAGIIAMPAAAPGTTTCVSNVATPNQYYAVNTAVACQLSFRAN